MNFTPTSIEGAWTIDRTPYTDVRGSFERTFCQRAFEAQGLKISMVQTNLSRSRQRHTLRGLHYQVGSASEAKLVQCVRGSILDVILDLRPDSPSFGEHISVELTDDNHRMLYVPEGCAHGFLSLSSDAHVLYQVSEFYDSEAERGIRWNDPWHGIPWPTDNPVLSQKDKSWSDYRADNSRSVAS